jgi:hypothetical protein
MNDVRHPGQALLSLWTQQSVRIRDDSNPHNR